MDSDIAASNTPAELDNAARADARAHAQPVDDVRVAVGRHGRRRRAVHGRVFRNATNTAEVPSYWLLNALASYEVNQHLTLRLNANNLTDERYIDRVGGGHYIPGPGRSVQLVERDQVLAMLLQIPDVLSTPSSWRRRARRCDTRRVGRRPGHRRPSVGRAKDNLQIPEGSSGSARGWRDDPAALHRNPLFISAALPLRVFPPLFNRYRAASRSATTSTTRSARCRARRTASAPTSRPRCSSPIPTNTTAASWWSRTPTACTA